MIIDKANTFSAAQAVTTTAASTDIIDLGVSRDLGASEVMFYVGCKEAVTAAGAATVTFALETAETEAFTSPTVLFQTAPTPKDALTAGKAVVRAAVPFGTKRYLRMNYTVGTGPLTAGKFDAGLVLSTQDNRTYKGQL